jgi:hypothetical protein
MHLLRTFLDTASAYRASALEMNFAKEVTDFSVKGIKKFHEDQAKKFEGNQTLEKSVSCLSKQVILYKEFAFN